jgi:ribosomal protein S18
LESIPGWWWVAPDTWTSRVELLREFVAEYKKIPKTTEKYKDFMLGDWCHCQRSAKNNPNGGKNITKDQITLLESVPGWWWVAPNAWTPRFELLREFVAEHGRLPLQKEAYKNANLGIWCNTQRSAKNNPNGGKNITKDQITLMESIPGWLWEALDAWTPRFELLREFVAEHGRLPLQKEAYKNANLGSWCNTQRSAKNNPNGGKNITKDQITLLESVPGWWWVAPDAWTPRFELLREFVAEHGRPPKRICKFKDVNLGDWCTDQRQAKNNPKSTKKISQDRITLLESVPYWQWSFK